VGVGGGGEGVAPVGTVKRGRGNKNLVGGGGGEENYFLQSDFKLLRQIKGI